ncbi:MAG: MFS transporter [Anaerolineae bacterium]
MTDLLESSRPAGGAPARYPPAFFLAMASATLFFIALQSQFAVLPVYAEGIGVGAGGWGLTFTAVSWASVALRLTGGPLADRVGRKVIMLAGALVVGLGFVVILLIPSFPGLLLGRGLHGVGIGLYTTAYRALAVDISPPERRGEALGLSNLTFGLALVVAPPLGEWIERLTGYTGFFLSGTLFALLAMGLAALLSVRYTAEAGSLLVGARRVLPRHWMVTGVVGMVSVSVAFVATFTFMPLLAAGRAIAGVEWAFSLFALFDMIGQPAAGRLGDRFGRRILILLGLPAAAGGIYLMARAAGPGALLTAAAILGFTKAVLQVSLDAIVFDGAPVDLRGMAGGLQYASFDLFIGVFGWLIGAVGAWSSLDTGYLIMALTPLVFLIVMSFLLTPGRYGRQARVQADPLIGGR